MRILVAHLQESLQAAAGVLRPLSVVPVREQHDEPRLPHPLVLPARDELVEHRLRPVGEIPELRLPQDQGVGVLQGITLLEPHHAELAEDGVAGGETRLGVGFGAVVEAGGGEGRAGNVVEGDVFGLGLLAHDGGVTVREGAALHVLAGDADVVAFHEEGAEGQGLGRAPVDVDAVFHHFAAGLKNLGNLAVQRKIGRDAPDGPPDLAEHVRVHAGGPYPGPLRGAFEALPVAAQPVVLRGLVGLGGLEIGLVEPLHELTDLVALPLGEGPLVDEVLLEHLEGGGVGTDLLVEERLRKGGVVHLVVSVPSVAHHVDNDIHPPLVSVLHGHLHGGGHRQRIVTVAVEDGTVEGLPEIAGVGRGPGIDRIGREAHLVVHNNVDSTSHVEILYPRHLHGLVDDPLSGKGGVPVQQDGHDGAHILRPVPAVELFGARLPHHHGIDALEVGGIGEQTEVDPPSVRIGAVHGGAQVVLDVPAHPPAEVVLVLGVVVHVVVRPPELVEDERHGLAHDVGQHVEPAPVRHPDDEGVRAELRGAVHRHLEARHHRLPAVQTEPLDRVELVRHEVLEGVRETEPLEDVQLLFLVVPEPAGVLDALPDPVLFVRVPDVHVLHPQGTAVRPPQTLDYRPQRDIGAGGELLQKTHVAPRRPSLQQQRTVQIRVRKPVERVVQVAGRVRAERKRVGAVHPQRIQVGALVTVHLVRADQVRHPQRIAGGPRHLRLRRLQKNVPAGVRGRGRRAAHVGTHGEARGGGGVRGGGSAAEGVEVAPPAVVDGARVGQVGLVLGFGVEGGRAAQKIVRVGGDGGRREAPEEGRAGAEAEGIGGAACKGDELPTGARRGADR
mmetsp:Transcript_20431/g.40847  ORF Transcript_20431/g.40847 Transcript_20431/m.40847 type:complete len:841 (-) Transcript_20431:60-2582(-)